MNARAVPSLARSHEGGPGAARSNVDFRRPRPHPSPLPEGEGITPAARQPLRSPGRRRIESQRRDIPMRSRDPYKQVTSNRDIEPKATTRSHWSASSLVTFFWQDRRKLPGCRTESGAVSRAANQPPQQATKPAASDQPAAGNQPAASNQLAATDRPQRAISPQSAISPQRGISCRRRSARSRDQPAARDQPQAAISPEPALSRPRRSRRATPPPSPR